MGKNGDKLRAAKLQTQRLYTDAQIIEIQRKAVQDYIERYRKDILEHAQDILEDKVTDTRIESFCLIGAIPLKVLIEKFGWKHPNQYSEPTKSKAFKFFEAMTQEVNRILQEDLDLAQYSRDCCAEYGFGYVDDTEEEQ